MSKLVQTIRFVVGVAMVAGGVALAAPVISALLGVHWQSQHGQDNSSAAESSVSPMHSSVGASGAHTIPDARQASSSGTHGVGPSDRVSDSPLSSAVAAATVAPVLQRFAPPAYQPPAPPAALPAIPAELLISAPGLDVTYRSTLDIPPPPLLDVQAPQPLAMSWSAHDAPRSLPATTATPLIAMHPASAASAASAVSTVSAASAGVGSVAVPALAVMPVAVTVRDGDDLTSIALRVYGHPGAAAAIWAANRDRLPDPSLLPIGLELRMPPSWTVPAARAAAGNRAEFIEPDSAIVQAGMLKQNIEPRSPWLQANTPPPPVQPARPRMVRVGPGETLATLAVRFYGDRALAGRIWEANRNQLRSPELVVAGMELQIP